MTARAADGLEEFLQRVKDRLIEAEVVGFDETGLRVATRLHWVHCARTGKYTLITCHPQRGRVGIDDAGVLSRFRGTTRWPVDSLIDKMTTCASPETGGCLLTTTARNVTYG